MAWEYSARMSHHSRTGYATAAVEDMPPPEESTTE